MDTTTVLENGWGLGNAKVAALAGGMTSQTWSVEHNGRRWVLKSVPAEEAEQFARGLDIAARLDRAGIPAGAPEPTSAGELVVELGGQVAALLRWVDGEPLTGHTKQELELLGRTLAAAHLALDSDSSPRREMAPGIDLAAPHLDLRPWIRPAVAAARAAVADLDPETLHWGPIHGDPAPEAFRLAANTAPGRDTGADVCGLIDWGAAHTAPRIFDLASAVMYASGPEHAAPLIDAYITAGALPRAEVERALAPMLTYRWAIQADYFAWRITQDVTTGIADLAENEEGLEDARRGLAGN